MLVALLVIFTSCTADAGQVQETKYNLTYESGVVGEEIEMPAMQSCDKGGTLTIAGAPSRDFYFFAGWSDGANTYQPGDSYTLNQNTVLTAVWTLDTDAVITPDQLAFKENEDGSVTLVGIAEGVVKHPPILKVPETDRQGRAVTAIAESAFESNGSILSIVIPSAVKSIGARAFANCSSVKHISFSEGLESIGEYAFYHNAMVSEIVLPDSLTQLGAHSFRNCNSLRRATLGKGVSVIGESAFRGCSSLQAVIVSQSLSAVGDYAFDGCTSIVRVLYPGLESEWKEISFGKGNLYFQKGASFTM